MEREEKFWIILAVFISTVTFMNIVSPKIINVLGLTFSVGGLFYAITFPCTDVISECWGRERANRTVLLGFAVSVMVVLFIFIAIKAPAAGFWLENQEHFARIFGMVPRIVLGSMASYLTSQLHDVWAFHFWRKKTKNKHLWLRNNLSTMSSQLIDTFIFITVAFYGTVEMSVFVSMIWGQYLAKVILAAFDTPVVYLLRNWIGVPKKLEKAHRQ